MVSSTESFPSRTRWKKLSLDQLLGSDYSLRLFLTSPLLRGEPRKQCEELINEVRTEINARPDDCMRKEQPGFSIRIICCEDCPFKEYGLRKYSEVDKWFDDFEIETGIPGWCPKLEEK